MPFSLSLFVCHERCQTPLMLPTSEHSLSQTTRGTFFMVCVFVPRPGGEPKTVSVWRCYDTPAYEQPVWERNVTLLQRDGAGGEELGV